jgi:hypothetical protein
VAADKDGTRFDRLKDAGNGTLQLVIDYVKQETLDPLKGLGRFIAFGVLGSVLLAIGLVVLAVALLRVLQGETDGAFDGNLSWIPYLICTVVVVAVAAVAVLMIQQGDARRKDDADKEAA